MKVYPGFPRWEKQIGLDMKLQSGGSPDFSGQHYYSFSSIFSCQVLSWGPSFSKLLESVITLNIQKSCRIFKEMWKSF